jgi:signal transduction histidine kinase
MKLKAFLYGLGVLTALYWLGLVVYLLTSSARLLTTLSGVVLLEILGTTLFLWQLAKVSTPAYARAWQLVSLGFAVSSLGSLFLIQKFLTHQPLSPSWGDPFLVVSGLLILVGSLQLPRPDIARLKGLRFHLEIMIPLIFFSTYFWRFAFAPQLVTQNASLLTMILQTLYLLENFGVLSVLLMILFWTRFAKQSVLLSSGIGLLVTANMILALLGSYNTGSYNTASYNTTPLSIALVAGILCLSYLVFCWGAYRGLQNPYPLTVYPANSDFVRSLNRSPYASILASYLLILFPPPKHPLIGIGVIVGIVILTLVVLVRQFLQITDNEKLAGDLQIFSEELERRVLERGKALEDSQSRLVASEKLASLGRLTAGLAHEINTPLAAAMHSLYQAQELSREYKSSLDVPSVSKDDHKEIAKDLEQNLSSAQMSLERLGEFVRRMRSQTRLSSNSETFHPSQSIRDVVTVLQHRATAMNITLGLFEPNDVLTLHGDPTRFAQVVSNLLVNALDACEGKADGFVSVRLSGTDTEVRLEVHDNGVGITEDIKPKIFEPMFTTKEVGQGTGLGLAVVYDIVHGGFGGDIEVQSALGQGTTFTVRFPVSVPVQI